MKEQSDDKKQQAPGSAGGNGSFTPLPGGPPRRLRGKLKKKKLKPAADKGLTPGPASLDPAFYINRELSWLEFNHRVLEEAQDARHPLLERVKFLSIVSTNLDEFFMIRVAAIKEQILADLSDSSPDGQGPVQQLQAVHRRVERLLGEMSACFWEEIHPKLGAAGIHLLAMQQLQPDERKALSDLFAREIFPVLTPLAFDPGHPFPYISNLSLSLAAVVTTASGEERFARVKVPDVLPRLVEIPGGKPEAGGFRFVWLEDLIASNLGMLFPGMAVRESYAFRVTRNADIEIQEDEAGDLISSIEESIKLRRFGSVVRVGVQNTMPARIRDILMENLEVGPDDVYQVVPPLGFGHLMSLLRLPRPDLKDSPFVPAPLATEEEGEDIFTTIRRGDVVLHHPYDSFSPVVQFIRTAAADPSVLAIKQTLYRVGRESPLIPLLIEAAESGKQVAVLVELKARFDEENNIIWAKQLERAGIHVVYGLVGLKTHAKIALVVRKEQNVLRRYVHLGTGNYNPVTARIYTDVSLFTSRDDIAQDASEVFNFLTGYSDRKKFNKLIVAPVNLRKRMKELIQREIEHAAAGRGGRIVFKMNALTDVKMIELLYAASQAGVSIDLIIRGICSLRPGVKGLSENVRVISVVGRYLEHSRAYFFGNGGTPELYLSSADVMGRNLDRRVELMFPVEDRFWLEALKHELLDAPLRDTARGRLLQPDGTYVRLSAQDGQQVFESQGALMKSRAESGARGIRAPGDTPQA